MRLAIRLSVLLQVLENGQKRRSNGMLRWQVFGLRLSMGSGLWVTHGHSSMLAGRCMCIHFLLKGTIGLQRCSLMPWTAFVIIRLPSILSASPLHYLITFTIESRRVRVRQQITIHSFDQGYVQVWYICSKGRKWDGSLVLLHQLKNGFKILLQSLLVNLGIFL